MTTAAVIVGVRVDVFVAIPAVGDVTMNGPGCTGLTKGLEFGMALKDASGNTNAR